MSDDTYGFFSAAGEALARRLIGGVISDVQAESTSRRHALDRLAQALERIAGMERLSPEQDTLDNLALCLEAPFRAAGFLSLSGVELRGHCEEWSRRGSPVSAADACPALVLEAARAARRLSSCARDISRHPGVSVAVSVVAPWENGFCNSDGMAPADVVLFPWKGDVEGDSYVGCVVCSCEAASYIENVVDAGSTAAIREGMLGDRGQADGEALFADLARLQVDMSVFNIASAKARQPSRLGLSAGSGSEQMIQALWDGDPLPVPEEPAIQPRRSQAPVAVVDAVCVLGFAGEDAEAMPSMR